MVHGDYASHQSSTLAQINRDNVKDLKVRFMTSLMSYERGGSTGVPAVQQTPLVNNGYLYVNSGINRVFKIDVRDGNNGKVLWVNDPKIDAGYRATRGRGISLLGDFVYTPTVEARLIKMDANSGETAFDINAAAPAPEGGNQGITAASLAIKDMIILGHGTGSGHGHRAWLAAFDAGNGSTRWRTFMVPGPGEPGHETWKDNHNAYKVGGAAIWSTPSYDPATNLIMVGTGDAAPWHAPEYRPGDNLYSVSTVALDADTGKIKWFFQEIPQESWDYDTVSPRMLYDIDWNGTSRKVMGTWSRNGFYYTLDRLTGEFLFAKAYTKVTWTAGLDPKTGKPIEYNPAVDMQEYGKKAQRYGMAEYGKNVCPQWSGQPTFWPPHFDAKRMWTYVQGVNGCRDIARNAPPPTQPGDYFVGGGLNPWIGAGFASRAVGDPVVGEVHALDVRTGDVKVRITQTDPSSSGILGTAGDILFWGNADGRFAAYDKDTLKELWGFNVGTGIRAPAITYSVDGKQYVAVVVGAANNSQRIQPNEMLVVFSL